MNKNAFVCKTDIEIHFIHSPGTLLPNRDDLYVAVELLGTIKRTRLLSPTFPIYVNETLSFERTFWSPSTSHEVIAMLEDLPASIELRQITDIYCGGTLLAYLDSNARDLLYPYSTDSGNNSNKETLLSRTVDFQGISPRLQYSTHTVIEELFSPDLISPSSPIFIDPLLQRTSMASTTNGQQNKELKKFAIPPAQFYNFNKPQRSRSRRPKSSSLINKNQHHQEQQQQQQQQQLRYRSNSVQIDLQRIRSPTQSWCMRTRGLHRSNSTNKIPQNKRPPFVIKKVPQMLTGRSPSYHDDYYEGTMVVGRVRSPSPPTQRNPLFIGCEACRKRQDDEIVSNAENKPKSRQLNKKKNPTIEKQLNALLSEDSGISMKSQKIEKSKKLKRKEKQVGKNQLKQQQQQQRAVVSLCKHCSKQINNYMNGMKLENNDQYSTPPPQAVGKVQ